MKENSKRRAIAVGIFIIIGIAFLVGGVLTIGNLHSTFQRKMSVSTIFGDVNGLTSGNNVWFSGVKIGTVKKTEYYGSSQVKVIININIESRQYIRKNAKVKISTDGLIGNKIIVIYGGTSESPEVEEGDTLANEILLSTEEIMNTFQQNNLNVLKLTSKLSKGEGTIGRLLNSDSIYRSINATTRSLQLASANAEILIASLSKFGSNLNKKGTLANDLVTDTVVFGDLRLSMLKFHSIADSASLLVSSLNSASRDPKSPIGVLLHDEAAGTSLKATITNLESSSKLLDKDLEGLQHSWPLKRYFKKEARKNGK